MRARARQVYDSCGMTAGVCGVGRVSLIAFRRIAVRVYQYNRKIRPAQKYIGNSLGRLAKFGATSARSVAEYTRYQSANYAANHTAAVYGRRSPPLAKSDKSEICAPRGGNAAMWRSFSAAAALPCRGAPDVYTAKEEGPAMSWRLSCYNINHSCALYNYI